MSKPDKQRPFGQDYLLAFVMMFLEPVLGIAWLYGLYRVFILPTWLQVLLGLGIWAAAGYGIYRLHQKMKKGLEKE
ncbi:hypothetical protein ACFIQF_09685 [Comamonas sp. J-3]|uniref:hypothetical protein n=1 Tax=Comamonas trifloxystrobinivorans TaxID=3350256 RepID=UPI003727B118